MRVGFDPGVAFGAHWHPGEEIAYVIEGTLEYQVEGKPPVTLETGDVLFIPARAVHSAKNVGRGTGAELATLHRRQGAAARGDGEPPLMSRPLFRPVAASGRRRSGPVIRLQWRG